MIYGLVLDASSDLPVPDATVSPSGGPCGVLTDSSGQYALELPSDDSITVQVDAIASCTRRVLVSRTDSPTRIDFRLRWCRDQLYP